MKVRFTEHAIDRFIERRMSGRADRRNAMQEMWRLFEAGTLLREKTPIGDTQVLADDIVFIVKHDGTDGVSNCLTVLFDDRGGSTNQLAQEIERYGVSPLQPVGAPLLRRRRSRRSSKW